MIADLAHERGLSVGLKNDLPQISQLLAHFDFAVNEECAQYDECAELTPFIKAGKAVFHVEYTEPRSEFCAESRRLKLSSMRRSRNSASGASPAERPRPLMAPDQEEASLSRRRRSSVTTAGISRRNAAWSRPSSVTTASSARSPTAVTIT